ncbi:putative reverse transcriptase domain-containing protein [Tanacetum coccineum]
MYEFWLQEVRFLRHVVSSNDIYVDSSYYRHFIANFSKVAKPLASLTQKNRKYEWGMEQEESFQSLKDNLCNASIFSLPDEPEDFLSSVKDKILSAPVEASKVENAPAKMLRSLDQQMEKKGDGGMKRDISTYVSKCLTCSKIKAEHQRPPACVIDFGGSWDTHLPIAEFSYNNSYHSSVRCAPFEALHGRKCMSPVLWAKIRESRLIKLELVQETTDEVILIKEMLKAARD